METDFNRYTEQCINCSRNVDNCDEDRIIDPDSECTLDDDMDESTSCDFFNDIRR